MGLFDELEKKYGGARQPTPLEIQRQIDQAKGYKPEEAVGQQEIATSSVMDALGRIYNPTATEVSFVQLQEAVQKANQDAERQQKKAARRQSGR